MFVNNMGNCFKISNNYNKLLDENEKIKNEFIYKILFIGKSSVGKSSIISRICQDEFLMERSPTIGIEFMTRSVDIKFKKNKISVNKKVKIQFWDFSGQNTFTSIVREHCKNNFIIVFVFSLDDKKSFDSLENMISDLNLKNCKNNKFIFIGNKSDKFSKIELKNIKNMNNSENIKIKNMLLKFNCEYSDYFLMSALTRSGIKKFNKYILKEIKKDIVEKIELI